MYCCAAANSWPICSCRRSTKACSGTGREATWSRPERALKLNRSRLPCFMATCLVTGGAGFLGSHLCDALLARGERVICVDNLETGTLQNIAHIRDRRFVHVNVDIIEPYVIEEPVDVVYHLASP